MSADIKDRLRHGGQGYGHNLSILFEAAERIAELEQKLAGYESNGAALSIPRIRAIATIDGGGYQELCETDPEYSLWTFSDEALMTFAYALLATTRDGVDKKD